MQVRVWNKNTHVYREKFRGKDITIPAGHFVEMARDEAILFKGTMPAVIEMDANGQQKRESYKMIEIEYPKSGAQFKEPDEMVCHATGKRANSKEELEAEIEAHADSLVDEEAKEQIQKRGRGRPKKS